MRAASAAPELRAQAALVGHAPGAAQGRAACAAAASIRSSAGQGTPAAQTGLVMTEGRPLGHPEHIKTRRWHYSSWALCRAISWHSWASDASRCSVGDLKCMSGRANYCSAPHSAYRRRRCRVRGSAYAQSVSMAGSRPWIGRAIGSIMNGRAAPLHKRLRCLLSERCSARDVLRNISEHTTPRLRNIRKQK
jgi:hypothetical protein